MQTREQFFGYKEPVKTYRLRENVPDLTPYTITLPDAPPLHEIAGYGLPYEKQFFTREVIPEWVWKLTRKANTKEKGKNHRAEVYDIADSNPEYSAFIKDQWKKRINGVWQYIRGVPTYIPGSYWYHLNYYNMDIGLPDYRKVDLEYWYWWVFCVENDPNVYGGIEVAMRRDGKSYRAASNMLEYVTRKLKAQGGIQSKTDTDAKDAFQNKIILPLRNMPFYFVPKSDTKPYPTKEINFRDGGETDEDLSTTSSNTLTKELNSWIEARPTVFSAFDSTKLKRYWLDEPGKTTEMLISQTWRVHKQCLRVGPQIVGKALLSTTVEETVKGGLIEFVKIWDQSDHAPQKLKKGGQTESGLVRYFRSAYETYKVDQYGESIVETPKPYQQEYLKSIGDPDWDKGGKELVDIEINSVKDPNDRVKQIRMYPRTIREALRPGSGSGEFNEGIILARLDDFLFGNDEMVEGNLEWVELDKEVKWTPVKGGRWSFKKTLLPYILERANNVKKRGGRRVPGNKEMGLVGADPYKFDATSESRKSLGTMHAFINYNPAIENQYIEDLEKTGGQYVKQTDCLFLEYGHRHRNKKLYGEDLIMTCFFLGIEIFPEINVPFVWDYFVERGYEEFLRFRKLYKMIQGQLKLEDAKTPGQSTTGGGMKDGLFTAVGTYIEEVGHRCVCHRFLEDCRDVEVKNLSPYDYFVSGAYAISGSKMVTKRAAKEEEENPPSFDGMWQPTAYAA